MNNNQNLKCQVIVEQPYLINLESEITIVKTLVKNISNDQELGKIIRENFKYYFEEK